jgi:high-affinity nickel-transport protein
MQSAARRTSARVSRRFKELHARVPYLKRVPANAVAIILFIAFLNVLIWVICGIVLVSGSGFVESLVSGSNFARTVLNHHRLSTSGFSSVSELIVVRDCRLSLTSWMV